MKKYIKKGILLFLALCVIFTACGCDNGCRKHRDSDNNGVCDKCYKSVFVYFDFYALGDRARKTADSKLEDYLNVALQNDENAVLLSTGNMWTSGNTADTLWLKKFGFSAMVPGACEFNLGKESLKANAQLAEVPLLAINLYDSKSDKLADFCKASTVIESNGIRVGVIGAIGDYNSSPADNCDGVYAKVGEELTELVKKESTRLRKKGADFIVYLHNIGDDFDTPYYNQTLSDGYIDLVLEGGISIAHEEKDTHGVYHLINNEHSSENVGVSHAEVAFNTATGDPAVRMTELVSYDTYKDVEYIPSPDREDGEDDNKDNSSSTNKNDKPDSEKENNNQTSSGCKTHADKNDDGICDKCSNSVIVYFDFYGINDLHGKLADADSHIGVDELTTYLKNARKTDDNAIFVSAGDMWQGQSESNMTKGLIMTDWMNELDFAAMALGNHEYDWGGEYIEDNEELAEFPFLAINVYDRATNKRAEYCEASTVVEADGLQIGIIGAIGDCYSSIAVDKCADVYFKVGSQLTSLVKAESDRLRKNGVDFIVYVLHDGYGNSSSGALTASQMKSYYDVSLSDGYVDLVFEGHTHQGYRIQDEHGVYHLQNRGDNKGGISHAEVAINSVTSKSEITSAELISTSQYQNFDDDPIVDRLLEKYKDQISAANEVLGYNSTYRDDEELEQLVAKLYYEVGLKEWGDKYKIVLGGGFLRTRDPYNLYEGDVTYGQLSSLFTFDNQITLCSVKGRDLKRKFFETNNSDYFISYGDYGNSVKNNIDPNATYYIVVDTYTADYGYNNLTIVERYREDVFARDLLAEYIKSGGFS